MGFRFEQTEDPGPALRRVTLELLGDAGAVLRVPPDGGVDVAVHEARKSVKKARTALRLGRTLLGKKRRKRLDADLRALAKVLAPARDATVRVATARSVARRANLEPPSEALAAWLAHAGADVTDPLERSLASLADGFDVARADIRDARWKGGSASDLEAGLERMFRDGRDAWRRVGDPPKARRLHACRTHVKHVGYVLRLLEPAWPEVVRPEAHEVRRLAEALGHDHDRSVLRARLLSPSTPAELAPEASRLVAAVEEQCRRERALALPLAARLFAERPKGFAQRHVAWWSAWRRDRASAASTGDARRSEDA